MKTDAEILIIGYAILDGDRDSDDLTKAEWNRFEILRFDAEEDEFLDSIDEDFEDTPVYDRSVDTRTRLFNIAQS